MSIERLTKQVKDKQEQLEAERKPTELDEREALIKASLDVVERVDFWCDRCRKDFTAKAYKVVQRGFASPIAFYEARCLSRPWCGRWCRRWITDKLSDPYYNVSLMVRKMREQFRKDMIQPGQPGFNMLYGDPNKKFYEELEARERKAWKAKPGIRV